MVEPNKVFDEPKQQHPDRRYQPRIIPQPDSELRPGELRVPGDFQARLVSLYGAKRGVEEALAAVTRTAASQLAENAREREDLWNELLAALHVTEQPDGNWVWSPERRTICFHPARQDKTTDTGIIPPEPNF